MSNMVQESWSYKPLVASGQVAARDGQLGGFLCSTAGTVTVYDNAAATGNVMVANMPVTAGVYHPMPFSFTTGCYFVLAGGATGTVAFD